MESNETHIPLGLIEGPWLSPLASTPPGPRLIRSTDAMVGAAPGAPGASVVRKMSDLRLLSFETMLLAAPAWTTRSFRSVPNATERLVHFPAFCEAHWSEVPVGRTLRSPPLLVTLTRSMAPDAGSALARDPQAPAIRASTATSPTERGRRPTPEDRGRLMCVDLFRRAIRPTIRGNTNHKLGQI